MSIHVTDFKWKKGKNDLEYIALLEKNLDVMADKFRECAKVAREQYNKGYAKGKTDGVREFAEWLLKHNKFDLAERMLLIQQGIDSLIAEYEKEQKNG